MKVQALQTVFRRGKALTTLRPSLNMSQFAVRSLSSMSSSSIISSSSSTGLSTMKIYPAKWNGSVRMFSTEDDVDAATQLSECLDAELAEEEENETTTMPTFLQELKGKIEEGWRIVEGMPDEDGSTIRLIRKDTTAGKVSIVFHCQDTVEDDEEADYEEGDEEEEESSAPHRFSVMLSKRGNTMVISCLSQDGSAVVESVAMTNEDADTVVANGIDEQLYQGPEYSELSESMNDAFEDFVKEDIGCGVNDDVAAFIAMYADYREQCEYVRWLKSVKNMVN
mmetsp:Transcript_18430/g.25992  ORF Transcript_18430/g.25992 Transcript_18430/m.25992 type:complete len:281 (+) Transcript_18430:90-932(+)